MRERDRRDDRNGKNGSGDAHGASIERGCGSSDPLFRTRPSRGSCRDACSPHRRPRRCPTVRWPRESGGSHRPQTPRVPNGFSWSRVEGPARLETCRGRTLVTAERAVGASTNRRPCERSALAFSRPPASNIVRSWPCFHNRSRFVNHAPPTPGAVQLGQHCATLADSKHAGPRVPSPGGRSSRRLHARIAELKRSSDQGFEKWRFRQGVRFPAIGGVAHMQGGQPSFLDRVRIALSRVISVSYTHLTLPTILRV